MMKLVSCNNPMLLKKLFSSSLHSEALVISAKKTLFEFDCSPTILVTKTRRLSSESKEERVATSNIAASNYKSLTEISSKYFTFCIVGGGAGGCSLAAKLAKKFQPEKIVVIDPSKMHYYQPMFTLVGGGMKSFEESGREMKNVLPKRINWINKRVTSFDPENKRVEIEDGNKIRYDFLIVATGIELKYHLVKGLPEALKEIPEVCSNYSSLFVQKTFEALKNFKNGNAIFTFPNTPVKCAGAPQKILYIAEDYFRKTGKRGQANIIYNTSLQLIFGVKKYADSLMKIVKERDIQVNFRQNLIQVIPKERKAIFQDLNNPDKLTSYDFNFLHATPPMGSYEFMKNSPPDFCDEAGFLKIDKETLQHTKYDSIFGIGDCTNAPTAKTAAAVAGQCGILYNNLLSVMDGKEPTNKYDGYTSCPLITRYDKCILAEFDYNLQPLETFPLNQAIERKTMFHLKKDIMPHIYWELLLKGNWNGPGFFRKLLHLGFKN